MKSFKILLFLAVLLPLSSIAQIYDPVDWKFSQKELSNNEFEVSFAANIEDGWHLYSQHLPNDDGPIATTFYFEGNQNVELLGDVNEPEAIAEYDPNFDMELKFFSKKVVFKQKVKVIGESGTVKGELEFMVCDEKMCLPPELVPFEFNLKPSAQKNTEKTPEPAVKEASGSLMPSSELGSENSFEKDSPGILEPVEFETKIEKTGDFYTLTITADIDEGWHLYSIDLPSDDGPIATEINFIEPSGYELNGKIEVVGEEHTSYDPNFMMELSYYEGKVVFKQKLNPTSAKALVEGEVIFMVCNDKSCIMPPSEEFEFEIEGAENSSAGITEIDKPKKSKAESKSLWAIFLLSFLGGFAALLTPCVFPMIPLTVSFFTKQSKTKAEGVSKGLLYGLSIIVIYVLLGFGITRIFGADALNALSTNAYFNIAFFILLTIFAISFFGAFEITLPSSWVNKVDSASDKGGLIGIFFMAFTLSLVSFSCTGPIIGTLLVEAAVQGGIVGPLIGMFGFSLALAMPFALFATFPGWLNSLPKSGGWLNSVKVVLGFLELALALKFLSNADLVLQAGYITREVFLAAWIGIFLMLSLYLLNVFSLPHDSPLTSISVGRALMATITLIFTIYLIPGLWGAPLKIISGFPPPMFYSESPNGVGSSAQIVSNGNHGDKEQVGEPAHCPHNLNCFHDYDEGMAYAKKVNKPVMLDFTGWACVNCRKMEEQVWSDPRVLERLQDNVVLISLYVDEKLELPKDEQIEVKIGDKTKTLKTVGNKWSYFQATKFKTNSQPYYIILDHAENPMLESAAYDPDIDLFIDWLDRGVEAFEKKGKKG